MAFDSLQSLFHASLTDTMANPALFFKVLDFDWENGKFFALNTWSPALTAIQGHIGLGRG
jgi:hypothetical protein